MQITASAFGGSGHLLSEASHSRADEAHSETSVVVQSPSTSSSWLFGLTPPGGLHLIAEERSTTAKEKEAGLKDLAHDRQPVRSDD
jgi:hypothetical protein